MSDNFKNEKLLNGPLDQNFLPENNSPQLNAKEFLKQTPEEELKNIFGYNEPSTLEKVVQNASVPLEKIKPIIAPKQFTSEKIREKVFEVSKNKISTKKIIYAIILFSFILFLALYIWGGILKLD
jgi:hypothetical protein